MNQTESPGPLGDQHVTVRQKRYAPRALQAFDEGDHANPLSLSFQLDWRSLLGGTKRTKQSQDRETG
jgi:hypothetical protein